ncbi:hypothetical protein FJZ33_11290, partial [Candidatus Poribacteria bacterium]|nr:hypothetical protein [Candidatus Poribacteria bacterium]
MKNTRRLYYTAFNLIIGVLAFITVVISYGRASNGRADVIYFYLIGLLTWIFGLGILISRPDDSIAFLSYLMSLGFMSVCSVDARFSIQENVIWSKFVPIFHFFSISLLPCVFVRCFSSFPSVKWFAKNRIFKWLIYLPGFIFGVILSILYLAGYEYSRSFFFVSISPAIIPNAIFVFGASLFGHGCLIHTWVSGETRRQRKQAKWLFLGISIGTVPLTFIHTIPFILSIELPYGRVAAYTLLVI